MNDIDIILKVIDQQIGFKFMDSILAVIDYYSISWKSFSFSPSYWPWSCPTPVEETAQEESALTVPVELPKTSRTSASGAANTTGIKPAANALFPTRVEETETPLTTTPMDPSTLDFGRSTKSTGAHVAEERPLAIWPLIWTAPSRFGSGEETALNSGQLLKDADVDLNDLKISMKILNRLCWWYFKAL